MSNFEVGLHLLTTDNQRKPVILLFCVSLLQCQSNQPICLVSHKQRDIQNIVIQFQIVQREPDPELDLIRKQFLELFETFAGCIGLGLDLYRENIILPLDKEIHFIGRIALTPVPGNHFILGKQSLKHEVLSQCAFELGEQAVAFSKGRRGQLGQAAEQSHIHQINLKGR